MIALKTWKVCLVCVGMLFLLGGCGSNTAIKDELAAVSIDIDLPAPSSKNIKKLSQADDAVYEQQLAACELYIEAYELTDTSDYVEKYKDDVKKEKVAFYCNERRKELQLEISTALQDNIYSMVKNVEDCENISAYITRVDYDAVNFYDYYAEYLNSSDKTDALCTILKVFYEKTNILAFRFMAEHEEDFVKAALVRIEENARQNDNLNMYIAENNELTKALNEMYGGVPEDYAVPISEANRRLARKLLESDSELSTDAIDSLMYQLGEPTPAPTESPTPRPTPTPEPTPSPTPRPTRTPSPTQSPTQRPATPAPTQPPAAAQPTSPPQTGGTADEGPSSYYFTIED